MPTSISVILATRDRPELFAEALASVLAQTHPDFEVVVVNDGSAAEHLAAYQRLWDAAASALGSRFQVRSLQRRPKGHGQSYSLNEGVASATGEHVCFLDDDDKWTDVEHLARAARAIDAARQRREVVDLYMSNQNAWINDDRLVGTLWLGSLVAELQARQVQPDELGSYRVTLADLLSSTGFCHLNCLLVRRALYQQVGGMDEGIRWECDRDLFLKLVDAAQLMLHHPAIVSYHRVPDPTKSANMTTAMNLLEKRLLQSLVMDRAIVRSANPLIQQHARLHKGYALKKMAQDCAAHRDWARATLFAGQALGLRPSLGWLLFSAHCLLRRVFKGSAAP